MAGRWARKVSSESRAKSSTLGMASPSRAWQGKSTFFPWTWCGFYRREPGLGCLAVDKGQNRTEERQTHQPEETCPCQRIAARRPPATGVWNPSEASQKEKKKQHLVNQIHRVPILGYTYTSQVRPIFFLLLLCLPTHTWGIKRKHCEWGRSLKEPEVGSKEVDCSPGSYGGIESRLQPGEREIFTWMSDYIKLG